MDFIEDFRLIECPRDGQSPDMDVYDAVSWHVATALTEKSIAHRSPTMDFTDFTLSRWQTRPPIGIIGA